MVSKEFRKKLDEDYSSVQKNVSRVVNNSRFQKMNGIFNICSKIEDEFCDVSLSGDARELVDFIDTHHVDVNKYDFPDGSYELFKEAVLSGYYDMKSQPMNHSEALQYFQNAEKNGKVLY